MFGYDSGYDTDDTDELLARKGCSHVPICTISETSLRANSSAAGCQSGCNPDHVSAIVNDDWLFSLDSTRRCGDVRQDIATPKVMGGRSQCPEDAARKEMGIEHGALQLGKQAPLRTTQYSDEVASAQAAAVATAEKASPKTAPR